MGSYTQLAKHMSAAARGSNRRGLGAIQRDTEGQGTESEFICPSCHEDAVVESECARCREITVPRKGAVFLASKQIAPVRFTGSVTLTLILLCLMSIPLLLWSALAPVDQGIFNGSGRAHIGPGSAVPLLSTIGVAIPVAALTYRMGTRAVRRWAERRLLRTKRALHEAVSATPPSELPRGVATPVRVLGTVDVDEAGTLRVEGDDGTRVRVEIAAATATGPNGEVLVLRSGERVDVLGCGERMRGAGQGYRDAEGDFVFTGEVDILRQGA